MLVALEKDRRRLAELETAIWDVGPSLSELIREQTEVQKRLDDYKYPVLTLPNEIVGEIFVHFVPLYPRPPPLIGIHSPILLTKICRKWREIALATPVLWRAIQLITGSANSTSIKRAKQRSEVWLRRSGSCSLSIDIDLPSSGNFTAAAFTGIIAHRARWEHLKFDGPTSALLAINGSMPRLRHLDLSITDITGRANDIAAFNTVPLLRTVVLRRTFVNTLPWEQLTGLSLVSVNFTECVAVLRRTPQLLHCDLVVWPDGLDNPPDIALPRLQSLSFLSMDVNNSLDYFVAPTLRKLDLREQDLGPNPIAALESFISKAGCSLQQVCISRAKLKNKASYLQTFPSIPNFSFTDSESYDKTTDNEASDVNSSNSSDVESD
ncbi:hypothetical protein C8R45DRAFT_1000588 [Mycena sanguinolenta]|nr:hypothetical protein C8R45DRAFT_1000588 [Mycena sanguinolenta]